MREKILIVDDELSFKEFICETLEDAGFSVKSAGSGIEALDVLKTSLPDIIITDIMMPGMGGLELIGKVRETYPDIIALVMTAFGDLDTARLAMRQGAYDFILKPFDIDEILNAIHQAMNRSKLVRENAKLKETLSLYKATKTLNKITNIEDMFQLILKFALNQISASRGSLMIVDENRKELSIKASVGLDDTVANESRVRIGEGIAGRVAETGDPILVTNISEHPLFNKLSHNLPFKSFISAPLIGGKGDELLSIPLETNKKVVGVLNLTKQEAGKIFTEGDLHIIAILASQAAISIENVQLFQNLEDTYLSTIKSLSLILEGKSSFTQGHSERVTDFAEAIAKEMSLTSDEINFLKQGAILHDIGKIGVKDTILDKEGTLTEEEQEIIKQHPVIGYDMLKPIKFLQKALPIVRHHHERMDCKGYPDGKSGEDLTCTEHISIVADAYDAMASDRPYRKALTREKILDELEENVGTQFDKEVVATFINRVLKEKNP